MPQYLSDLPKGKTLKTYLILAQLACFRQTITFSELGDMVGMPANYLAPQLELIYRYCAREGLPHLTTLVVNSATGEPSLDLHGDSRPGSTPGWREIYSQREAAYNFGDWLELVPPSVNDFF